MISDETNEAQQCIAQKKILRSEMKERVAALSPEEIKKQSHNACNIFLHSALYAESGSLLLYMAMKSEIDPLEITMQALRDGKQVALPRIVPHTSHMSFYLIKNTQPLKNQLIAGMWGIREPAPEEANLFDITRLSSRTVTMVTPGVAFTTGGLRIGHGRGYYDMYLSAVENHCPENCKLVLLGMCLSEQVVAAIPTDRYDKKMKYLLTDTGLADCLSL